MKKITIFKGVPIPKKIKKEPKYPIYEMNVGDSFLTTDKNALGYCKRWGTHDDNNLKFTSRKEGEKIRIWRTQ